jgi:hypothetical protein
MAKYRDRRASCTGQPLVGLCHNIAYPNEAALNQLPNKLARGRSRQHVGPGCGEMVTRKCAMAASRGEADRRIFHNTAFTMLLEHFSALGHIAS